jgi:mRNA interferase MazF
MTFERWDLILAPYPYVEVFEVKLRPSLVLTTKKFNTKHKVCFAAMITTAKALQDVRSDDFEIGQLDQAGLLRPCVVRLSRLSTIDLTEEVRKIGILGTTERTKIERTLKNAFDL